MGNPYINDCVLYMFDELSRLKHPKVEKVVYNDPATIVIWNDGTKTVVKCHPDDVYDPEKGFLLCCAKKLLGGGKYNDVMRKHVPPRSETVLKALKRALGIKDES